MLERKIYQDRLIGIVVDEAHCVVEWGTSSNNKRKTAFRVWYSKLNELKSLIGCDIPFLALTATATKKTKQKIFDILEISNPYEISEDPNRPNILYAVEKMDGTITDQFLFLVNELKEHGRRTIRTIIYCQTIKQCSIIFNVLNVQLGPKIFCDGSTEPQMRLCEMMHSCSPESVKNHVLNQFSDAHSHLRVLIATTAYGMGVNSKNVTRVIHFGPSKSVEAYMQESGRCGRNGEPSKAVLLFNGITIRTCDTDMRQYIRSTTCRRQVLLQHFHNTLRFEKQPGHMCCDICAKTCVCNNVNHLLKSLHMGEPNPTKVRNMSDDLKEELREKLNLLVKKVLMKQVAGENNRPVAVSFPNNILEFGIKEVEQIVQHAHIIFSVDDVMKYVNIWQRTHALQVLDVFSSMFQDLDINPIDGMLDSDDSSDDDQNYDDYTEWDEICQDPSFLSLLDESDTYIDLLDESQTNENSMEQSGCPAIVETVLDQIGDANDE